MARRLPDFIIIGAMKAGTSSLHEQLRLRSGIFMSTPKEPNFFSDDPIYARGLDWYASHFAEARPDQICGESSTHYTKLPTFPRAAPRMKEALPDVKLIYVMRDPIERIVSQYIHEWTQREVDLSFPEAVRRHERFVAYSCYGRQLRPYIELFGQDRILLVASERLQSKPDDELPRICRFIGDPTPGVLQWNYSLPPQNASRERVRHNWLRDMTRSHTLLRRAADLLPRDLKELLKRPWKLSRRPDLPESVREELEGPIDSDLTELSQLLECELSCRPWRTTLSRAQVSWR